MSAAKLQTKFQAKILARIVAGIIGAGALIFLSAGRLDYWQGWVYLGLTAASLAVTAWVLWGNPELISERLQPGGGVPSWDKLYFALSTPLYFVAIAVSGLDAGRFGWSGPLPALAYAAGFLAFLLGQALFLWAKAVNRFFSSVVRIQSERGHSVVDQGPYRVVRHPGYVAGLLFGLSAPLILGSYWGMIPQGIAALLLVWRTAREDRFLRRNLPGYDDFAREVRWRLVPGIW